MNHYKFIEKHGQEFSDLVDLNYHIGVWASAHGDKCYGYRDTWKDANIEFNHGAMIYLLSYCYPFSTESRTTENGWVPVDQWVIEFYNRPHIKAFFESCE